VACQNQNCQKHSLCRWTIYKNISIKKFVAGMQGFFLNYNGFDLLKITLAVQGYTENMVIWTNGNVDCDVLRLNLKL